MVDLEKDTLAGFLEGLRGLMMSWAIEAGADSQDAMDITQDVMLSAVLHYDRLSRLDDTKRAAWFKKAVRRKVIDDRRYWNRDKRAASRTVPIGEQDGTEPRDDGTSPSSAAALRELRTRVLAQLPEEERQVCTLLLEQRRNTTEIAHLLGIDIAEVEIRFARGLSQLKSALQKLQG